MATIITKTEGKRGCGFRKGGGIYLVSDKKGKPCGKLPLVLDICPCCSAGIKPSRGWTWVDADKLFENQVCKYKTQAEILRDQACSCPLDFGIGRAGLLWIGEAYYKTPQSWLNEAETMGVSRRIKAIPRGFKLGETWILCAHRKAIETLSEDQKEVEYQAAIFHVFLPDRLEYIVKGDETEEELDNLEKRGLTLVKIVKKQQSLLEEEEL